MLDSVRWGSVDSASLGPLIWRTSSSYWMTTLGLTAANPRFPAPGLDRANRIGGDVKVTVPRDQTNLRASASVVPR